jgi:hypothetical protein
MSINLKLCAFFCEGVDDAVSECGLDSGVEWDFVIQNNMDQELEFQLKKLYNFIETLL